jgi:hypothetical protein
MSLSLAIAANVILDVAIIGLLAYAMCRPARFQPHGTRHGHSFEAIEASVAAARHLADTAVHPDPQAPADIEAGVAMGRHG